MSDWIDLQNLFAVAVAQHNGWEIEKAYTHDPHNWEEWVGSAWHKDVMYRGRPKAERKVVRVREAVMQYGDQIWVISGNDSYLNNSSKSFIGWVKGSEWREVEYE